MDRQQKLARIAQAYEDLNIDITPDPDHDDELIDAIIATEGINIIGSEWAAELAGMTDEEIANLSSQPAYQPLTIPPPPEGVTSPGLPRTR